MIRKVLSIPTKKPNYEIAKPIVTTQQTLPSYLSDIDWEKHCLAISFLASINKLTTDWNYIRSIQVLHEDTNETSHIPNLFLNYFNVTENQNFSAQTIESTLAQVELKPQIIILTVKKQDNDEPLLRHAFSIRETRNGFYVIDPADKKETTMVYQKIDQLNSLQYLIAYKLSNLSADTLLESVESISYLPKTV